MQIITVRTLLWETGRVWETVGHCGGGGSWSYLFFMFTLFRMSNIEKDPSDSFWFIFTDNFENCHGGSVLPVEVSHFPV